MQLLSDLETWSPSKNSKSKIIGRKLDNNIETVNFSVNLNNCLSPKQGTLKEIQNQHHCSPLPIDHNSKKKQSTCKLAKRKHKSPDLKDKNQQLPKSISPNQTLKKITMNDKKKGLSHHSLQTKKMTKKAKKSNKKKKANPNSNEQDFELTKEHLLIKKDRLEKIIKQSEMKAKREKDFLKSKEQEERYMRIQQQQNIERINHSIRRVNAMRFNRVKEEMRSRLPWGANEQRLKKIAFRVVENIYKAQNLKKQRKNPDEKERRKQLGLDWLNNFDPQTIQTLIRKREQEEAPTNVDEKNINTGTKISKGQIQQYMQQKRKITEQCSLQQKVLQLLQENRKRDNLCKLNDNVREIFNKCRTSENSLPQTPKYELKNQSNSLSKENYSLLYEEYKKFINGHINKKQQSTKKDQLKMRFQELANRFQNALQTNDNDISKPRKQFQPEEFILEEEEDHISSRNHLDQESSKKELSGDLKQIQMQPQDEDYDQSLNELAQAVGSDYQINLSQKLTPSPQNIPNQQIQDEGIILEDELRESQIQLLEFHMINQAAILIQKVWRGYFTRKVLQTYLEMVFNEQEAELEQQKEQEEIGKPQLNPFGQVGSEISGEKLVHCSTIKSSITSEYEQIIVELIIDSVHHQIFSMIQQEFEKSSQQQIDSLFRKDKNYSSESLAEIEELAEKMRNINQSTQQNVLNLMQQLVINKRIKSSELSEDSYKKYQARDIEWEQKFNEARKQAKIKTFSPLDDDLDSGSSSYMQKKELNELIQMREQSIDLRMRTQQELFQILYEQKQLSESKYKLNQSGIKKWVEEERNDLQKTKRAIEMTWKKASQAYKKIQLDLQVAQKCLEEQGYNSLLISNRLEQNEEILKLQKEFSEQLKTIEQKKKKLQSSLSKTEENNSIKIIDNFQIQQEKIEDIPETQSQEIKSECDPSSLQASNIHNDKNLMIISDTEFKVQNFIERYSPENDKKIAQYQMVSIVTSDILDQALKELMEELYENSQSMRLLVNRIFSNNQPTSINTSLDYINQYILDFFKFVLSNYENDLNNNLNVCYGFLPVKRLRLIHGYDDCLDSSTDSLFNNVAFVLDENLFLQYEQFKLQNSEIEENLGMKEFEHIHNKAIFDACNEVLNWYRPYFQNCGKPYPWEEQGCQYHYDRDKIFTLLEKMKCRMLEFAGMYCGFLDSNNDYMVESEESEALQSSSKSQISPDKQKIIEEKNQEAIVQLIHSQLQPLALFSQENKSRELNYDQLQAIREERMLYNWKQSDQVRENDFKWYNYSDDQAELLMEVGDMLFESLVEEFASENILV